MVRWDMFLVSLTGFAAGTLCTLAYLPQALHSFRTKSVRDLSLLMLISLHVGLLLWAGYGFMIHSLPIILPNAVTFFLSAPSLTVVIVGLTLLSSGVFIAQTIILPNAVT